MSTHFHVENYTAVHACWKSVLDFLFLIFFSIFLLLYHTRSKLYRVNFEKLKLHIWWQNVDEFACSTYRIIIFFTFWVTYSLFLFQVLECHLVKDPHSKESRGFAFVTMDSKKDAEQCVKHLNRSVLEGRLITVEKVALLQFSFMFTQLILVLWLIYRTNTSYYLQNVAC